MKYTSCPVGTILHWGTDLDKIQDNRYKVIKGDKLMSMWEGKTEYFSGYPENSLLELLNGGSCQIINQPYEIY